MYNRIARLELLFWLIASIVGSGILLEVVALLTNTGITLGGTHPFLQALCLIMAAVVALRALVSRFHDIGWTVRTLCRERRMRRFDRKWSINAFSVLHVLE